MSTLRVGTLRILDFSQFIKTVGFSENLQSNDNKKSSREFLAELTSNEMLYYRGFQLDI